MVISMHSVFKGTVPVVGASLLDISEEVSGIIPVIDVVTFLSKIYSRNYMVTFMVICNVASKADFLPERWQL